MARFRAAACLSYDQLPLAVTIAVEKQKVHVQT